VAATDGAVVEALIRLHGGSSFFRCNLLSLTCYCHFCSRHAGYSCACAVRERN